MKIIEEPEWEFHNYSLDLEKEWQKSLSRFTDKELLDIFPEAKEIMPQKIAEAEEKRTKLVDVIRKKLMLIKQRIADEFSKWFWREFIKNTDGEKLLKIDNNIARLKRLFAVSRGWKTKGRFTEEQIGQALAVPIESLIAGQLRKSGKRLFTLCPLHIERHPSFCIYTESNRCWCFGCSQGGDSIKFVKLLYDYSFREAIGYLIKK